MCRTCTRCHKLHVTWKGKKLFNGKSIMGAGRLTDKAINTLQNYYGMVGRNNVGYLYQMKKSVWATLFHNCDIAKQKKDINFPLTYVQVGVCGGQINFLLAKKNIERN